MRLSTYSLSEKFKTVTAPSSNLGPRMYKHGTELPANLQNVAYTRNTPLLVQATKISELLPQPNLVYPDCYY